MLSMSPVIVFIIFSALIFDFINGFHDSANSIATVVSTRVLSPRLAVIWAAFFNSAAALVIGLKVSSTIGKGIISTQIVDNQIIFCALFGAIVWGLLTWWKGMPSSSSHALVGGLIGAAVVKGGTGALIYTGISKTLLFIVLSPLLGFLLAVLLANIVYFIASKFDATKTNRFFRVAQLFSAAAYSLGHGGNDAQKTMGIIALLLFSSGYLHGDFYVPIWVIALSYLSISMGTLFGGFRIVKTMGTKITKLKPSGGFVAETAGAITLFLATSMGIPVSTTHTITGAIVGVGSVKRFRSVRWTVASRIVWAWVFTIPAAAVLAAISFYLLEVGPICLAMVAVVLTAVFISRKAEMKILVPPVTELP